MAVIVGVVALIALYLLAGVVFTLPFVAIAWVGDNLAPVLGFGLMAVLLYGMSGGRKRR